MSRLSAWHGFEVDMSLLATDMAWVLSWLCHVLKPLLADFGRSISTEPNGSISRAGLVPRRGENLQLSAGPICSSELNTESSFTMTLAVPGPEGITWSRVITNSASAGLTIQRVKGNLLLDDCTDMSSAWGIFGFGEPGGTGSRVYYRWSRPWSVEVEVKKCSGLSNLSTLTDHLSATTLQLPEQGYLSSLLIAHEVDARPDADLESQLCIFERKPVYGEIRERELSELRIDERMKSWGWSSLPGKRVAVHVGETSLASLAHDESSPGLVRVAGPLNGSGPSGLHISRGVDKFFHLACRAIRLQQGIKQAIPILMPAFEFGQGKALHTLAYASVYTPTVSPA
ncbi:hypothetical protein BDZ45DRAFT_749640 [Acephala macrosclerotiorum]|nr:hypothetical protein BDZ45DRAFT_749640 [Acephala macrosclerotiorum]